MPKDRDILAGHVLLPEVRPHVVTKRFTEVVLITITADLSIEVQIAQPKIRATSSGSSRKPTRASIELLELNWCGVIERN